MQEEYTLGLIGRCVLERHAVTQPGAGEPRHGWIVMMERVAEMQQTHPP